MLNAEAVAAISAEAEEGDRSAFRPVPQLRRSRSAVRGPTGGRAVDGAHRFASHAPSPVRASVSPGEPTNRARGRPRCCGEASRPDTRSELRDWIKDNATLLSNASLLISLAAVALSLLPDVGIFSPYIKALIFAAALLLLTELHHQWPEDLQLHMLRKNARPENHSWRMTSFALVMQVATLLFAAWAILTTPIILLPLTALAVVVAFYRWYFRRHSGVSSPGSSGSSPCSPCSCSRSC